MACRRQHPGRRLRGRQHTIEIGRVVHHTKIDEGISSHHGRLYTQPSEVQAIGLRILIAALSILPSR
jgi:hypothetical protein